MKGFLIVFGIFLILSGCGEEIREPVIESPEECLTCHSWSTLSTPLDTSGLSPKEHMLRYGRGVMASLSYDPTEELSFSIGWVKRGNHATGDKNRCFECHNSEDWNHGGYFYPLSAQENFYKNDCSFTCHGWIKSDFNPFALLELCTGSGHQKIFRDGYRDKKSSIKISEVKSGCGGCHSLIEFRHGSIPDCLNCHRFKNSLHSSHEEKHGGEDSCGWCHNGYEGDMFRASCYNCHGSGHCPGP